MPVEFIERMGKYVAFLQRQMAGYFGEPGREDMVGFYSTKIETARDICVIFGYETEVFAEACKWYKGD